MLWTKTTYFSRLLGLIRTVAPIGIPSISRAASGSKYLDKDEITILEEFNSPSQLTNIINPITYSNPMRIVNITFLTNRARCEVRQGKKRRSFMNHL